MYVENIYIDPRVENRAQTRGHDQFITKAGPENPCHMQHLYCEPLEKRSFMDKPSFIILQKGNDYRLLITELPKPPDIDTERDRGHLLPCARLSQSDCAIS